MICEFKPGRIYTGGNNFRYPGCGSSHCCKPEPKYLNCKSETDNIKNSWNKEWDEKQFFPKQLLQHAGEMGFMGVLVPEEFGGSGLTYDEYITVIDEISQIDSSIGLSLAAHNSLCTGHILQFGNEEQKKKYQ